jgi:hypothetical protein
VLRERVPGPVLSVVEARGEDDAIGLVAGHEPAVSVWTGDRRRGERLARVLGADVTWVNDHGFTSAAAAVRVARHVAPHQLASQPARMRSSRWLPYDPMLVRASTASARLLHGRESERLRNLRRAAWPLARTAVRLRPRGAPLSRPRTTKAYSPTSMQAMALRLVGPAQQSELVGVAGRREYRRSSLASGARACYR